MGHACQSLYAPWGTQTDWTTKLTSDTKADKGKICL